ncbi:hypothetical protein [uncultured Eubacterium sp.]|uniref:hypothetical protein n=1 Tax=uncultured Eubacterium sp. TaxID=165185 RepID=UPI003263939F
MSQALSAFCLQKRQKVFGECIITEKKRSGFDVVIHGGAMCITKLKHQKVFGECIITEKKQSGFEMIIYGEAISITKVEEENKII